MVREKGSEGDWLCRGITQALRDAVGTLALIVSETGSQRRILSCRRQGWKQGDKLGDYGSRHVDGHGLGKSSGDGRKR